MNVVKSPVFWYGVVAGLALVYAYHHFAVPLPGTNRSPAAKRANGGNHRARKG